MVKVTINKIRRRNSKYFQFTVTVPKAYGEDIVGSKDSAEVEFSQYGDAYLIKPIK